MRDRVLGNNFQDAVVPYLSVYGPGNQAALTAPVDSPIAAASLIAASSMVSSGNEKTKPHSRVRSKCDTCDHISSVSWRRQNGSRADTCELCGERRDNDRRNARLALTEGKKAERQKSGSG